MVTEGWRQEVHSLKLGKNKHEGFPSWLDKLQHCRAPKQATQALGQTFNPGKKISSQYGCPHFTDAKTEAQSS